MAYTDIDKPSDYFNTVLYTGTGSELAITGVGFQPDWTWIKRRDAVAHGGMFDNVRGATKLLSSSQTDAEQTIAQSLKSFDSDGFTLGTGTNGYVNTSGSTTVAWNWLASNTTASNTVGDINSTVSVNTTSGFSIVSYTGNGSSGSTVGHGLGVAPKMTIIKQRNSSNGWNVWHYGNNNGDPDSFGELNSTSAWYQNQGADGTYTTQPTSSLLTLTAYGQVNGSGNTYIAYCFAEKKGFSKFGSYTGNGSTDGPFIYTGFKPALTITKRTSDIEHWGMYDSTRDTFNPASAELIPNLNASEGSFVDRDFLSNGFKIRSDNTARNGSGDTYIYMAFAENPFVTSTGIPTTAR